MMKTNTVYKRAYNNSLDLVRARPVGGQLGSETELSAALGVSRTTVRAVLATLAKAGFLTIDGMAKTIASHPADADYFPGVETQSASAIAEKKFMAWILDADCRPSVQINGLDLARQFGVSTSTIREYLNHFSRFGLIERRPNSSWVFKGFTEGFALELCEIREMFELRSAQKFADLEPDSPTLRTLEQIERDHLTLLANIDERYKEFSELDERLHRLVNDTSRNRFVVDFYDVISMIFHYHYQWSKVDEKERNLAAIHEHLAYIAALRSRDVGEIVRTCLVHMQTARTTLLRSISSQLTEGAGPERAEMTA